MRGFIDGLCAEHRFGATLAFERSAEKIGELVRGKPLAAIHPVVRVHPETNERVVYVNQFFTKEIVDLSPRESRHVLDLLFEQISRPEYSVRFKWDREALRSGTIGPRCISRRATSSISITSACCIGSRWSATSRSARTGAHRSRWRASSSGPPDRAWARPHRLRCDHSRPSTPNAATAVVVSATGHNAPPTWATTEVSSNGMSPPMMVELWPDNDIPV